jgi:hypothetical protein
MKHAEFDVRGSSCELSVASAVRALAFVPGESTVTCACPKAAFG